MSLALKWRLRIRNESLQLTRNQGAIFHQSHSPGFRKLSCSRKALGEHNPKSMALEEVLEAHKNPHQHRPPPTHQASFSIPSGSPISSIEQLQGSFHAAPCTGINLKDALRNPFNLSLPPPLPHSIEPCGSLPFAFKWQLVPKRILRQTDIKPVPSSNKTLQTDTDSFP